MGAMAPYFEGRIGPGWDQLGARTSDVDYSQVLKRLKKRPLDYFKMFYADTALFGAYDATVLRPEVLRRPITCCLHPTRRSIPKKGPMYIRETIAIVDRLPIGEDERRAHLLAQCRGTAAAVSRAPSSTISPSSRDT